MSSLLPRGNASAVSKVQTLVVGKGKFFFHWNTLPQRGVVQVNQYVSEA
jgi:hypothetical protein